MSVIFSRSSRWDMSVSILVKESVQQENIVSRPEDVAYNIVIPMNTYTSVTCKDEMNQLILV